MTPVLPSRPRLAVVGSGVAGLTAAWVLAKSGDVTLFEADSRLGGHADTHDVTLGGRDHAVDTGFIVHNLRTYPTLLRLFDEVGLQTRESEMSMSIRDDATGIEWAGALGLSGVFPTRRMLLRRDHWGMVLEIPRFHRRAKRLLRSRSRDDQTLEEFLRAGAFSDHFRRHFMEPLVAAVWSCDPAIALDYPAAYLFTFLHHHGMLRVFGSPRWRTVVGGSRTYVDRVAEAMAEVCLDTKVTTVVEDADGVEITDGSGAIRRFDAAVIATHPGQALDLLGNPTQAQHDVLSAIGYSPNMALLHTDATLLPTARRARASWNFQRRSEAEGLTVTYDLSRLQVIDSTRPLLLTLNGSDLVDPHQILDRMEYEHPIFNPGSVAAQRRLPELNSDRLAFAGAYHGWGFHEDGARSGRTAAEHLGFSWGPEPGLYRTTISHTRRTPFARSFTHQAHLWLVDLDDVPKGVRIEARDHLGDPQRTIRHNVEAFLAGSGVATDGGRILLATQPRAWGHCFNPMSVFWCFDRAGALTATVVEVHNTYGDRHAYLVRADEQDDHGRSEVTKAMYVSPFHGVDGTYTVAAPVPGKSVHVSITLNTESGQPFSAALTGTPVRDARERRRASMTSLRVAALIRVHGIWLWIRRLPIQPRPHHHQPGVSP